jgi:hypothetical protein
MGGVSQTRLPRELLRELEGKLETGIKSLQTGDARVYSVVIVIGLGRVTLGPLGSRPRPAALSDSPIVYAGSFSRFTRRL